MELRCPVHTYSDRRETITKEEDRCYVIGKRWRCHIFIVDERKAGMAKRD
jgi:hypothetical protein